MRANGVIKEMLGIVEISNDLLVISTNNINNRNIRKVINNENNTIPVGEKVSPSNKGIYWGKVLNENHKSKTHLCYSNKTIWSEYLLIILLLSRFDLCKA